MSEKIFPKQSDEVKDLLVECYKSTEVFAKTLFPDRFYLPFSKKIHSEIFRIIDDDSIQRAVIAAPRGIGKTSIVNLVCPARGILLRNKNYIIPISCSADAAIEQSENLKQELVSNETILSLFGSCKSGNWSEKRWDAVWKDDGFTTRVKPRGAGQQVRGPLFRNARPDLIIVDDLEDPDHMDSEEQRTKKKQWFFADVCNSIARYGPRKKDWRILVLGTVLHEDSLLVNLLNDPNWYSVCLEICDDNFVSNWPEGISDKELKDLYKGFSEQGIPDVFAREYRNNPISTKDATFKASYFKYYNEQDIVGNTNIESVVIGDPAKTAQMSSADSAVVGVGVDTKLNAIYQRDLVLGKMHPDEFYDTLFKMALRLKARVIGVEVTGLHEFITYPLKNEMLRRGLHFDIIELSARRGASRGEGKKDRIAALVSFYRQGLIYHNRANCAPLEMQLLSFPRSRK